MDIEESLKIFSRVFTKYKCNINIILIDTRQTCIIIFTTNIGRVEIGQRSVVRLGFDRQQRHREFFFVSNLTPTQC